MSVENLIRHFAIGNDVILFAESSFSNPEVGTYFVLDKNKAITPNGFYLNDNVFENVTNQYFTIGSSIQQTFEAMVFDYRYFPIEYSITYNLDGGMNHSSNLSKYSVLNGVRLYTPTKSGCIFKGWEDQRGIVYDDGINYALSDSFSDGEEFILEMSRRTTGDLQLTALWEEREPQNVYADKGIIYARAFIIEDSLDTIQIDGQGNVYASAFIESDSFGIQGGTLYAVDFIEGTPT